MRCDTQPERRNRGQALRLDRRTDHRKSHLAGRTITRIHQRTVFGTLAIVHHVGRTSTVGHIAQRSGRRPTHGRDFGPNARTFRLRRFPDVGRSLLRRLERGRLNVRGYGCRIRHEVPRRAGIWRRPRNRDVADRARGAAHVARHLRHHRTRAVQNGACRHRRAVRRFQQRSEEHTS